MLLSVADPPPPPPQLLPRKETTTVAADCYSSDDDLMFRPVATKRGKKKGGRGANNRAMEESLTDFEGWKVSVFKAIINVWDPDPQDPHVVGPQGSGSSSQRYGTDSSIF